MIKTHCTEPLKVLVKNLMLLNKKNRTRYSLFPLFSFPTSLFRYLYIFKTKETVSKISTVLIWIDVKLYKIITYCVLVFWLLYTFCNEQLPVLQLGGKK